jgi:alpha-1,4-digalacturonate transport system permease protein
MNLTYGLGDFKKEVQGMSTTKSTQTSQTPSLRDWLMQIYSGIMGLGDFIFTPLQKLLGVRRMGYMFILPNLLIFGIFILFPMLLNFYFGFTSGDSILLQNREWVGTANLEKLFDCENFTDIQTCSEDLFWRSINNTAKFVVGQVGLMVLASLITALALNRDLAGRLFFRSIFFYPVLLSPVVVALIWKWILQHQYGLLNAFLVNFGFEKIPFLLEAQWARFWVIFVSVWAQMGFYTLILLAGLQSIPSELYEAASIDGANGVQSFFKITLPLLMPTMVVVLVLSLIRAVQIFDQIFVLTNGGPGTATLFIVQYIYRTGFEHRRYGMAAAASLVLAVVLLMLTMGQLALNPKEEAE